MVDESQELRRVSWTELFSFTHIFKTWRMARHYSKLVLAFAAIALTCLVGTVMDAVWGWAGATARIPDVVNYHVTANFAAYADKTETLQQEADAQFVQWMTFMPQRAWEFGPVLDAYVAEGGSRAGAFHAQLAKAIEKWQADNTSSQPKPVDRQELVRQVDDDRRAAWSRYRKIVARMLNAAEPLVAAAAEEAEAEIEKLPKEEDRAAAAERLERDVHAARRALWKLRVTLIEQSRQHVFGRGIFEVFAAYEQHCIANAFDAVGQGRIFNGAGRVLLDRQSLVVLQDEPSEPTAYAVTTGRGEPVGLVGWLVLMLAGLVWLAGAHWLYALVFGVLTLSIWALFGGAIARIAALHAAQEIAIPMGQALRFSAGKFFSFVTAPLLMLAIIFGLGLLLGLGGLISAIPVAGAVLRVVFALLFGLVLVIGAAITFVTIGLLAGFPLMYPAIAVEGSDSFDAISRSFSYVFGRPWRYGLYFLVSAVYGTICYAFVRLFAFGTLLATHVFVSQGFFGLGLNTRGAPQLAESAGMMDLLWGRPTFGDLSGTFHMAAVGGGLNLLAAWIIRAWVYVVVGFVAAFVLSFAVSAFTNIYYLLRRKVDATDLDDVYVEEAGEDYDTFEAEPAEEQPAEQAPSEPPAGEGGQGDSDKAQ